MSTSFLPPAQTTQELNQQVVNLRRALQALLDTTSSVATKKAMAAREAAWHAWRESLSADERQHYLDQARQRDPSLTDYATAIQTQGNWIAYELQNQGLIQ